MTVTEKASRRVISGFGWTNPLTHTFELENSTHLKVYADDVQLTLGVDYSITGVGVDSGYSVTITDPLDWSPDVWVLSVEPPINQADDVSLGGVFGARFEESLDAMARRVQRVWNGVQRSWKVPMTTAVGEAPTMDVLAEDHFWKADADGNMIDGGSAADISGAQGWATAAAASAAAALASAIAAAISAASINLPAISVSHKHKSLQVNTAGTGYEFRRDNFYSPYQYGATGDGVTDDTAAFVLCQTASNANEGIQAAPKGRGVVVVPVGNFIVSTIATQQVGEKWQGLGGTLTSNSTALDLFIVDHNLVQISGLNLVIPNRPTANVSCFHHRAGSDCLFENLNTTYGYYGIRGSGGADSSWINIVCNFPYANNAFFQGYQGLWMYRCKLDGIWPVNQPVAAQITGAMVNGAVYNLGDLVTSNGYWFVCASGGTAPAAGAIPLGNRGANITTSGTATWRIGTVTGSANFHIGSGCFIFKILNTDISGGHEYGLKLENDLATTAPQDITVTCCETGGVIYTGVYALAADGLRLQNGISHDHSDANDQGIAIGAACRGVTVSGYNIRGCSRGITIASGAVNTLITGNHIYGATNAILAAAGATKWSVLGNFLSGVAAIWGANATGVNIGAGCSNFRVVDNNVSDCTVAGITDASNVNALKRIEGNF